MKFSTVFATLASMTSIVSAMPNPNTTTYIHVLAQSSNDDIDGKGIAGKSQDDGTFAFVEGDGIQFRVEPDGSLHSNDDSVNRYWSLGVNNGVLNFQEDQDTPVNYNGTYLTVDGDADNFAACERDDGYLLYYLGGNAALPAKCNMIHLQVDQIVMVA